MPGHYSPLEHFGGDVSVTSAADVSGRPAGAVFRVPGRCGRCIMQGIMMWRVSGWCCRKLDEPVMLLGRGYRKRGEGRIKEGKSVICCLQVSANIIVLSNP